MDIYFLVVMHIFTAVSDETVRNIIWKKGGWGERMGEVHISVNFFFPPVGWARSMHKYSY